MADFGTGLRAHLETSRSAPAYPAEPLPVAAPAAPDFEERRRLEAFAAELAGRELELAQREADLLAEHEQMALALARTLLAQMRPQAAVAEAPADELAALRARRYGRAS